MEKEQLSVQQESSSRTTENKAGSRSDLERQERILAEGHLEVVRMLERLPDSAFHEIANSGRESIVWQDAKGHQIIVERFSKPISDSSIYLRVVQGTQDQTSRTVFDYHISYPLGRKHDALRGRMQEDGLHQTTIEQHDWDDIWSRFKRFLSEQKIFRAVLEELVASPLRGASPEGKKRIVKSEVDKWIWNNPMGDINEFLDVMRTTWDHAQTKDLLRGKRMIPFPEYMIPRVDDLRDHTNYGALLQLPDVQEQRERDQKKIEKQKIAAVRPPDYVLPKKEFERRQKTWVDREGSLICYPKTSLRHGPYRWRLWETGAAQLEDDRHGDRPIASDLTLLDRKAAYQDSAKAMEYLLQQLPKMLAEVARQE